MCSAQTRVNHSTVLRSLLFCCPPLWDAPTLPSIVSLQQTGPVSPGEADARICSVLSRGRELRVVFVPVTLLSHLVPVLSSTQGFYTSVRTHCCSSFIHVFLVLLCCFSSSLLLIASNRVSAETAAVSSTCNLSNPTTKFSCYCICNAALCGFPLAACDVSWILIKCFLTL